MKQLLIVTLSLLIVLPSFSKKKEKEEVYNETYRPQYHYTVDENKMGQPISIVKIDSALHLFYQFNSQSLIDGYYSWGQAISNDGLKWQQQEELFQQPAEITDSMQSVPWYGSVYNRDGKLYSWVNRWNDGVYLSLSNDGTTWGKEEKTKGTEKLVKGESYVFWYAPDQKWVMFGYDRASTTLLILNSVDGINWETTSSFNYNFGFPQVFELPVDRKPDEKLWVMATEEGTYALGTFDGETFVLKTSIRKFNHSRKIGSTVFYQDIESNNWYNMTLLTSDQMADLPSNGQLSFPNEVVLKEFETGVELLQQPSEKLKSIFNKEIIFEDERIYPGLSNNILKKIKGSEIHIKTTIDTKSSDQFGIIVRSDRDHQGTEINYNVKKNILSFLGTRIEYLPEGSKIKLEILIDRSSIELYIEDGRYVITYPFEPIPENIRYELYTTGGEINVDYMEVHTIQSIWRED